MKNYASPFEQLGDLASRVQSARVEQPSQVDFDNIQIAIGFTLLGNDLSASIGDVTEIINVPEYTAIPGTKKWMLGMANVRGTLLPIADLETFFGGTVQSSRRQQRVLVVENGSHRYGLLVSHVSGLQNLEVDQFSKVVGQSVAELADYIDYEYEHEGKTWCKFETARLFESADFINASRTDQTDTASAA